MIEKLRSWAVAEEGTVISCLFLSAHNDTSMRQK
jgi:hypothetical protein